MITSWVPEIDAQTWQVGAAMIFAFCAAAGWMLAGTVVESVSPRGRHRRGEMPDVFDRVTVGVGVSPNKLISDAFALAQRRLAELAEDEPDTVVMPRVVAPVDPPRHVSPTERARERWGIDCPIFAQLADDWGYELGGELLAAA